MGIKDILCGTECGTDTLNISSNVYMLENSQIRFDFSWIQIFESLSTSNQYKNKIV